MDRSFHSRVAVATIVSAGLFMLPQRLQATLWYVDQAAPGPVHDGLTWCTAYLNPSEGLQVAVAGDTIRVANGTYKPDPTGLANPREATFALVSGTALEGGYAGCGAINPDARDFVLYETILRGDLNGDDGPNYANNAENAAHVVTAFDSSSETILRGFTVTAGNAAAAPSFSRDGAALLMDDASPSVEHCNFYRNSTRPFGSGRTVSVFGGGATFRNCVFAENRGCGSSNFGTDDVRYVDCVFRSNEDGGMCNNVSSPLVTNCLFVRNRLSGMSNEETSDPTIINSTFAFNFGPFSTSCGAGMANGFFSFAYVRNSVFWGNTDANLDTDLEDEQICGFSPLMVYSDWQGHGDQVVYGNIDADPFFVDPDGPDDIPGNEDDDFRLGPGSPCIDAGNNSYVPSGVDTDLDGNERFLDGNADGMVTVDMGPYEAPYPGSCCNGAVCLQDGIGESGCIQTYPGARWFAGRTCGDAIPCPECLTHLECDDGLFCDGIETCDSNFGCIAGELPCGGGTHLECDEATDSCALLPIPTLSEWGLVTLALLLVTGERVATVHRETTVERRIEV